MYISCLLRSEVNTLHMVRIDLLQATFYLSFSAEGSIGYSAALPAYSAPYMTFAANDPVARLIKTNQCLGIYDSCGLWAVCYGTGANPRAASLDRRTEAGRSSDCGRGLLSRFPHNQPGRDFSLNNGAV